MEASACKLCRGSNVLLVLKSTSGGAHSSVDYSSGSWFKIKRFQNLSKNQTYTHRDLHENESRPHRPITW